jgi:geranylgeranyl reductase family protein
VESCDVLIVGGGPAGSTLAWRLRAAGLDTLILDKQFFPRDKICAGWITPAVVETLHLDLAEYSRDRVFQPIRRFVTGTIGGEEVHTDYAATVSYGIRRREFDDYLLRRCGSRLALGQPLSSLVRVGDRWLANGKIRAPLVVGAGGHFCPVARQLRVNAGRDEQVIAAQEIEFEMDEAQQRACTVAADRPELYFCDDLKGYGWVFRKGNFLNVGLGREDPRQLTAHVAAFAERLKQQGRIASDSPAKFHGHAYLLYPHAPRQIVEHGLLLIGDAAGLADPQSGEGIRPAVESAVLAAGVIVAACGDYRRAQLDAYVTQLTARFGKRADAVMPAPSGPGVSWAKQAIARWLLRRAWFARHVVLDRWFLHRQQAPLAS